MPWGISRCKCCDVKSHRAMEKEGWNAHRRMCYTCSDIIPEYIPEVQYRKYMKLKNG